jgi:hypothetical protein
MTPIKKLTHSQFQTLIAEELQRIDEDIFNYSGKGSEHHFARVDNKVLRSNAAMLIKTSELLRDAVNDDDDGRAMGLVKRMKEFTKQVEKALLGM